VDRSLLPFYPVAAPARVAILFLLHDIPEQFFYDLDAIAVRIFGLRGRRTYGAIIRDDPISDWITIVGYVFFVLTLIFAINFGNLILTGATSGVLGMQLSGEAINRKAGAPIVRTAKPKLGATLFYVILDLGLFAAFDIVGANPQALPGLNLATLSAGSLTQVFSVGALFTIQIGIAEERFFRGGLANYGAKYGGPFLGIATSAVTFFVFHIPADWTNPLQLLIIGADGAVLAWSDIDSGRILPSMIAHIINNTLFVLLAAVIGVGALGL